MLYAELDAFEPVAIQEHEAGDGWRVFFRSTAARDRARGALSSEFGNALIDLVPLDIDDEDWARRSQASLTAIRVGRIIVAPPWDLSDPGSRIPDPDLIRIVIDPSTGFGTGHHASTRLCLDLLQKHNLAGMSVIDVGTGSGVLAIAAVKLGAAHVIAIDNDPEALQNARHNVATNGATDAISIAEADLSTAPLPPADIVIANLTGAILQRYASALRQIVRPGGVLIVSGFTTDEQEDVARALRADALDAVHEDEWAAIRITNHAPRQP
jgi:ribosomal protein L11 methyltransferase